MQQIQNQYKSQTKKNTILLGLFLSLTQLSSIITSFINIPGVSVVISVFVLISAYTNNKKIALHKKSVRAYYILLVFLFVSMMINEEAYVRQYLLFYLAFATTSLFITCIKVSYSHLLEILLRIHFIYVIVFYLFLRDSVNYSNNFGVEQMGISYSMVPGVLTSFLYIIIHRNTKAYWKELIISLVVLIASLNAMLFYTVTRGSLVSIGITMFLLYYLNTSVKSRQVLIAVLGIIFMGLLFFSSLIINPVIDSLQDSSIGALNKLWKFTESGDISNGRDVLYQNAINIIKESPFWGRGVGFFEQGNSFQYVHQLFLQVLCEIGLIGALLFLLPLFRYFAELVRSHHQSTYMNIYILYFGSIITMLLFSNIYWLVPNFWFIYFSVWNVNHPYSVR